jgi:excisionase family DNA binding protein
LTAEEVADLIGMGVDWVYAQTRAKKIPHVRLGRYCRYRVESINTWLAALEDQTFAPDTTSARTAGTPGSMATGGRS